MFTHPALPLARDPRMAQEPLRLFPWASHPAAQEATTHARVGTGIEHLPRTTPPASAEPPTSEPTRVEQLRVARAGRSQRTVCRHTRSQGPPSSWKVVSTPSMPRDVTGSGGPAPSSHQVTEKLIGFLEVHYPECLPRPAGHSRNGPMAALGHGVRRRESDGAFLEPTLSRSHVVTFWRAFRPGRTCSA